MGILKKSSVFYPVPVDTVMGQAHAVPTQERGNEREIHNRNYFNWTRNISVSFCSEKAPNRIDWGAPSTLI